jgi:23S rRNA (uridine2552-2'-O)-methyltransferase
MKLQDARKDHYRRLAKEQGYRSRAAYKLLEANERYGFLVDGAKVLDFGSAPGGWLQVASELVGSSGFVLGVDLDMTKVRERNVATLKMDVYDARFLAKALAALGGKADVFLSDLSPKVSGVWELDQTRQADLTIRVLDLAPSLLRQGGSLFCKLFDGEGSQEVRARLKETFASVRVIKPAASRHASSELYYFCEGLVSR